MINISAFRDFMDEFELEPDRIRSIGGDMDSRGNLVDGDALQ